LTRADPLPRLSREFDFVGVGERPLALTPSEKLWIADWERHGQNSGDSRAQPELEEINERLRAVAATRGVELEAFQSNHEGALIDRIHAARGETDFIVINPGGYTHQSVSLRDSLSAAGIPVIEVHLSNIYAREEFRHHSMVAPVAVGCIVGFGAFGYELAVQAAMDRMGVRE
jgi:3-dehydroquinate dehydratase-2